MLPQKFLYSLIAVFPFLQLVLSNQCMCIIELGLDNFLLGHIISCLLFFAML